MADDLQITADYSDIQMMNRELLNVAKSARTSATTFEREYNRVEKALNKNARASQTLYSNILKLDEPFKDAAKSASVFERELAKVERAAVQSAKNRAAATAAQTQEEERLRRKFIEGHAAMDLYSKELNDLAVARKADIITAEQQRQGLERLNQQMASGTGVFSGYGAATQVATKRSNQLGVATQQAGYQIGDFLVQIQSGTNPMVAFGQQATQLVGVLPMVASQLGLSAKAAIGISTALGIGIPLFTAIAAAVGRFAIEALSASSGSKSFEDAMKALQEETEAAAIEVERLNRGLATTAQAKAGTEIDALRAKVEALSEAAKNADVEGSSFAFEALRIAEEELATAEKNLQANIDINEKKQQGLAIEKARADMQEKTLAAAQALLDETEAAVAAVESVKDRVSALEKEYGKAVVQAALLAGLDIESGISLAAIAASNLSSEMKAALASALGLVDLSVKYGMMEGSAGAKRMRQYAGRGTVSGKDPIFGETGESIYKEPEKDRGGGATDPLISQMEQLEKFLATEQELLLMEYETRQMTLEQSLEKEYITRQQYADMILELEAKKNKELTDIEMKTQQTKVSAVAGGIQDVLNAAANGNEKLLKAARVVGATEALINTYRAAAQTLADPSLPFFAKFAAVASVVASGLGMVSAIKSGSKAINTGVGRSAPSGAAAAVPASVESAAPQRVIIEGIDRNSLISGEQLSNIFEALYKENENRGFVFEVAR